MGRAPAVDLRRPWKAASSGSQEYLRYRVNGCDHASAESKVFSQIDGGPVPRHLFRGVRLRPVADGGDRSTTRRPTNSFEVRPNPGGCAWTGRSDASWLTFPGRPAQRQRPVDDSRTPWRRTVSAERTGRIRFTWTGGGDRTSRVTQRGIAVHRSFTMTDPFTHGRLRPTECRIPQLATPCNFVGNANLPGGNYSYQWRISYFYGTRSDHADCQHADLLVLRRVRRHRSNANGQTVDLDVTLTITDDRGNTITLRSGEGSQPPLWPSSSTPAPESSARFRPEAGTSQPRAARAVPACGRVKGGYYLRREVLPMSQAHGLNRRAFLRNARSDRTRRRRRRTSTTLTAATPPRLGQEPIQRQIRFRHRLQPIRNRLDEVRSADPRLRQRQRAGRHGHRRHRLQGRARRSPRRSTSASSTRTGAISTWACGRPRSPNPSPPGTSAATA